MNRPGCFILALHAGPTRRCLCCVGGFILFFGGLTSYLLWRHSYSLDGHVALSVSLAVTVIGAGLCTICFTAHRWFTH